MGTGLRLFPRSEQKALIMKIKAFCLWAKVKKNDVRQGVYSAKIQVSVFSGNSHPVAGNQRSSV